MSRLSSAILCLSLVSAVFPATVNAQVGPPNDFCNNATGPLEVPSSTLGATLFSSFDAAAPDCLAPITAPGVWYSVIGNGTTLTASFCGGAPTSDCCTAHESTGCDDPACEATVCGIDAFCCTTVWDELCAESAVDSCGDLCSGQGGSADYDSRITIYCRGCSGLYCVAENDDCLIGTNPLASSVSWCSQAGVEYRIFVHGFGTETGIFTLTLSEDETTCTDAVPCEGVGACCMEDESCIDGVLESDCALLGGTFQGAQSECGELFYPDEECTSDFENISGTGTEAPNASANDDAGDIVQIGFTFNFYGDDHDTIAISSNGYLTFDVNFVEFDSPPIPDGMSPNDVIAPFWDDWSPNVAGTVHYQTMGTGPNRRFIVQWTNVAHFSGAGTSTFQAVLFEGSNCIEFRYGNVTSLSPTIGVENQNGSIGTNVSSLGIGLDDCVQLCQQGPASCQAPGACCLNDGSCVLATETGGADCEAQGGAYQGDGTDCGSVTCPAPGACCLTDGSCELAAEVGGADCTSAGGSYQGDDTSCAAANCGQPGACCMDDGTCVLATELGGADCTSAGGDYAGDGTTCATANCPQPGACCMDDGSCELAAALGGADCTAAGGDYQGDDTSCAASNCPQPPDPVGACCALDGSCGVMTESACEAAGGMFAGGGVTCLIAGCARPGACCLPDGSCRRLSEVGGADCAAMGGAYGGDDTNCLTVDCPRPGACCMSDGTCMRAAELGGADCDAQGGTYQGDDTDCHPTPCSASGPAPEPEPEPADDCISGILPLLFPMMVLGWGWMRRRRAGL